jgi:tetratricopeptide (TPR) repeat protein
MRSISTSKGIFLFVVPLTLIWFRGTTIAQLPGRSVVAPSSTSKPTAPATRQRHAVAKTRTPRRTEGPPSDDSETSTIATPTTPTPIVTAGTEERKEGIDAYHQGDYDKAIEKLTAAGKMKDADAEIFYALGDSYAAKKQWQPAIDAYENAKKVNEPMASFGNYFNLGLAYEETKNLTNALTAYRAANARKANDSDTLTHLGDVSSRLSQWQFAVDYYEQAFKVDPNIKDPDVFFNWGIAYVNKSLNFEAALPQFKRAIDLNVDNVSEAYFHLGESYYRTNRLPEAIDAFQKQLTKKSDDYYAFRAYSMLGEIYFGLRDKPAAVDAFKNAVRIDNQSDRDWDHLGTAYINMNDYQEAAAAHRQAVALAPNNADYQLNLAKAYYYAKSYPDALEVLGKVIQLKPNMAEAYYYQGLTYLLLNQFPQAVEALNKSLEIGFEKRYLEVNARYNLAVCYNRLGNPAAARQQCDLLRTSGSDVTGQDVYGVCRP